MTTPTEQLAGGPQTLTDEQLGALNEGLDPRRVRQKPGSNKSYLATHDVVRTANRIFGFGRWGHRVVQLALIGSYEVKNGKGEEGWYTGYSCIVELTVKGCPPVSGVGYGDAFEKQWSARVTTHELAVKEAESDALKRALKNFGDQFGLILYAKPDEVARIEADKPKEPEALEPGDKPATPEQIVLVREAWAAAGKGDLFDSGIEAQMQKYGGVVVSSAWLARQHERVTAAAPTEAERIAEEVFDGATA